MKETTKNILKKWGGKIKKDLKKMGESQVSLDPLEALIAGNDVEGAIAEVHRLRKLRKKARKN